MTSSRFEICLKFGVKFFVMSDKKLKAYTSLHIPSMISAEAAAEDVSLALCFY